jgi:hypothetical protein
MTTNPFTPANIYSALLPFNKDLSSACITRDRHIAQAKKEASNALYFFKWLGMGTESAAPTTQNQTPDTASASSNTAQLTSAALDNLNTASAGFIATLHTSAATHDNLTNSISALIAAARKRPVDTAALIAAAQQVSTAAAAVTPATQELINSTAALTAAANNVHYTASVISETATLPHTNLDKVADFFNPCVNDKKLAA